MLDVECNSQQVEDLSRSFLEFDENAFDPESKVSDISVECIIADLQTTTNSELVENENLDSEDDLAFQKPPIALDLACDHITEILSLLETLAVPELPTIGPPLTVSASQVYLTKLRLAFKLLADKNKKQSNLLNWLSTGTGYVRHDKLLEAPPRAFASESPSESSQSRESRAQTASPAAKTTRRKKKKKKTKKKKKKLTTDLSRNR
jgi:hypothetical protein